MNIGSIELKYDGATVEGYLVYKSANAGWRLAVDPGNIAASTAEIPDKIEITVWVDS